jgi:hypothetical protein
MRVTGFWALTGAIVFGLIIADLTTHPTGTTAIANGVATLEKNTGNQLLGNKA